MTCQKCGLREGTQEWAHDMLALTHGFIQHWCERCVIETQLAHARTMAARIPDLERRLAQTGDANR